MRRPIALLVAAALLIAGVAVAMPAAAAILWPSRLTSGNRLSAGQQLVSTNGRYHALVTSSGRLVVRTAAGQTHWATGQVGDGAVLVLHRNGQLALAVDGKARWRTRTYRSGPGDVLIMGTDGVLRLQNDGLAVWSSRVSSRCPKLSRRTFVVDISTQRARLCRAGQQIRTTAVTTGASARGYGTPTGRWRVYAKVRNTTLYPAAGGAYPVKFWMPYSGPYGAHDSPWQRFPYGSQLYKTRGSHGCVHVPGRAMRWLFGWARIGTRVIVHR
ncbi:MAG TPA: L,D-transpeptidase family protein [Jatrophihabitans sp.]|nr:L,D-transpeptidase family protein [Jatrophihabitans sp.]